MQATVDSSDAIVSLDRPSQSDQRVAILLAILIFSGLSLWGAITSAGFLEADGCTHYLYARFAFQEPHYFVNVWGRPICTAIYSVPALIGGRIGVRVMSLALALACAGVTYAIARRQNYRWPALAFLFTLAQPMVFLHSFSELTELPFATLLACAFLAYQRRRWGAMAILIGLSPLSRPEGFGFVILAAVALIAHRRWWWLPLLMVPLIGWDIAGWILYGCPKEIPWYGWLKHEWPYAADSAYERGTLAHFVMLLPAVTSPIIFPAMVAGIYFSLSPSRGEGPAVRTRTRASIDRERTSLPSAPPSPRGGEREVVVWKHRAVCQMLIAVLPLLILIGHSVLYWRGKMASSGELRYMLVVAPFWALLAAHGWEWIFTRLRWNHVLKWAAAAALLPVLINCKFTLGSWTFGYKVLPLVLTEDWVQAATTAEWYRATPLRHDYPLVCASHPGIYYFLDMSPSGGRSVEWHRRTAQNPPPGVMAMWDPMYALYNSDVNRSVDDSVFRRNGWTLAGYVCFSYGGDGFTFPKIWLSPKKNDGSATSPSQTVISIGPGMLDREQRLRLLNQK
jgi:hypothetical protein